MAHAVIGWLGALPPWAICLAIGLLLATETGVVFGLVLPTEPLLLFGGYLAHRGTVPLSYVLVASTVGALLGDWLGYLEGRLLGGRLRARLSGGAERVTYWDRAQRLVDRGGGRAVLLGRWIAFVRTFTPRLAGVARLPVRRFAPADLLGVLVWVPGSVVVGYLAGASYSRLAQRIGGVSAAVVAVVLIGAAVGYLWHRRRSRSSPERPTEPDGKAREAVPVEPRDAA